MKTNGRLYEFCYDLTPHSEMCINCVYFVRHYIHQTKDVYVAIFDGHCRNGCLKNRRVYDICPGFVNKFYREME